MAQQVLPLQCRLLDLSRLGLLVACMAHASMAAGAHKQTQIQTQTQTQTAPRIRTRLDSLSLPPQD